MKQCNQKKCCFIKMGYGCHACKQCKAAPFVLDEKCDVCFNCSRDEGLTRWDNDEPATEEQLKKLKEILAQCKG